METDPRAVFSVPECGGIALGKLLPQLICVARGFLRVIHFTAVLLERRVSPQWEKFLTGNGGGG